MQNFIQNTNKKQSNILNNENEFENNNLNIINFDNLNSLLLSVIGISKDHYSKSNILINCVNSILKNINYSYNIFNKNEINSQNLLCNNIHSKTANNKSNNSKENKLTNNPNNALHININSLAVIKYLNISNKSFNKLNSSYIHNKIQEKPEYVNFILKRLNNKFINYFKKAAFKILIELGDTTETVNANLLNIINKLFLFKNIISYEAFIPRINIYYTYDSFILTQSIIHIYDNYKSELSESRILKLIVKLCLLINNLRTNKTMRLLSLRWLFDLSTKNFKNFKLFKYFSIYNYYLQPNALDDMSIKIEKLKILYVLHSDLNSANSSQFFNNDCVSEKEHNLYCAFKSKIDYNIKYEEILPYYAGFNDEKIMETMSLLDINKYFPIYSYNAKCLFKIYFIIIVRFPYEIIVNKLCDNLKENLKIVPRILPNIISLLRKIKNISKNNLLSLYNEKSIYEDNSMFNSENNSMYNNNENLIIKNDKSYLNNLKCSKYTSLDKNFNNYYFKKDSIMSLDNIYNYMAIELTKFIRYFKSHEKLNQYFALFYEISKEKSIDPTNLIQGLIYLYNAYKNKRNLKIENSLVKVCIQLIKHHDLLTIKNSNIRKLLFDIKNNSFDYGIRDKANLYYNLVNNVEKKLLDFFIFRFNIGSSNFVNNSCNVHRNSELSSVYPKILKFAKINNCCYNKAIDNKAKGCINLEGAQYFSSLDLHYKHINFEDELKYFLYLKHSKLERKDSLIFDNGSAYFNYKCKNNFILLSDNYKNNTKYSSLNYKKVLLNNLILHLDFNNTNLIGNNINKYITTSDILKLYLSDDILSMTNEYEDSDISDKMIFTKVDNINKDNTNLNADNDYKLISKINNTIGSNNKNSNYEFNEKDDAYINKCFVKEYLKNIETNQSYIKLPLNLFYNNLIKDELIISDKLNKKNVDSLNIISKMYSINISFGHESHLEIKQPIILPYLENIQIYLNNKNNCSKSDIDEILLNNNIIDNFKFPYFYKIDLIIYPMYPIPSNIETKATFYTEDSCLCTGKLNPVIIKFEDYFIPIEFPKNFLIYKANNVYNYKIKKLLFSYLWNAFNNENCEDNELCVNTCKLIDKDRDYMNNKVKEMLRPFLVNNDYLSKKYVIKNALTNNKHTRTDKNKLDKNDEEILINSEFNFYDFTTDNILYNDSKKRNNKSKQSEIFNKIEKEEPFYKVTSDLNVNLFFKNEVYYNLAEVIIFIPKKYHLLLKIKISEKSSVIYVRCNCYKVLQYLDEYFDSWF